MRQCYYMNSTRFDGWPAAVCSCVTLLNIMPLSFSPSRCNDMGTGIPEPPVAAQLHITSCGLPWIYQAHYFPVQTNCRIRRVGASMLAKPTESTRRQFNPPQRLTLYNRATREHEQESSSADSGRCMAGRSMTRKPPLPPSALISTFLTCLNISVWYFPNQFVLSD